MGLRVAERYLASSSIIDSGNSLVLRRASDLAHGLTNDVEIARRCYQFVRDEVQHSADFMLNPVTLRASDVLRHKTGFCFAKSHLLAALLRANGIPAGLCYQRIACNHTESGFCLHGLNAVYLEEFGWYRMDARGNSGGVHAEFKPPIEFLAFIPRQRGEAYFPEIWAEPMPCIISVLSRYTHYSEVLGNLPDMEIIETEGDV